MVGSYSIAYTVNMNTRTQNSIHIDSAEDALQEVLNLFNNNDSQNQAGCDEDDDDSDN
jgi:hypothetical protein